MLIMCTEIEKLVYDFPSDFQKWKVPYSGKFSRTKIFAI